MNCLQIFFSEHTNAIIDGLIVSAVIWLVIWVKKLTEDYKSYNGYSGKYIAYLKQDPSNEQFKKILKRKRNIFDLTGVSMKDNKKIQGQIEMSNSIKNYGTGYYRHIIEKDKPQKFGFYEIQLAFPNILVHQNIKGLDKNNVGEDNSAAYIWVKKENEF